MTRTIRWGILGASKFSRDQMAPAIHAAKGAELVALASGSPEKTAGFAAFHPGLHLHDSYGALLDDPAIDAVYIPLPNHLHVEWTLKALEAGKHVLCEKPIAMEADAFDQLIAARDAAGRLAAEAFMIVHHPQWQRARTLVQDNAIGRLVHIDARFSYDNRADMGNIRNRRETGGGSLPDIGVYTCGAARFVTGAEPSALAARIDWENGVDVTAHVMADLGGASFSGMTSMRAHPRQEVVLHGETGVMRLPVPFNAGVFGEARVELHRGMEVTTERFPAANHYVLQVENFCAAVRGEADYACSLEFSRGTQAMIDMILEAAPPAS
ncbi:Gfo/Idh/MocA family protein [Profundibacterium mesophilum]|uniref:Dihydrodiol dehydrogenase D-xylose 1-dehydrogenase n=1 Tax=Profundibacterium mesophilum KAUST100406-0324 TaxID=1037889 RepID=A0A921NUD7_9RHOB|nr:Gfo/Idh/MocA family oxidoreductase [Profundibacterium mesophilum]KAF0674949.1 dihydrodiol dehydrogenase D-xylose 1-dehydrogenase [Profundibacterium mesophilum KAUST100406-0324]